MGNIGTSMSRHCPEDNDVVAKTLASGERQPPDGFKNRVHVVSIIFMIVAFVASTVTAEDTVIIAAGKDGQQRSQKQGAILDYTGASLRMRSSLGREETIPSNRVLEVRTTWTDAHQSADALRVSGKLAEAIAAYRQAKRDEMRPWAVRQIMAALVAVYFESGQIDLAGDEFLGIVASDPTTQHFDVIPLAWRTHAAGSSVEARAQTWLKAERFPAAVLLGSSWLLSGSVRGQAIASLQKLTLEKDPRIAALAEMQLWRTRLVTAPEAEVLKWTGLVDKMPAEIRAGGYFLAGEALARRDHPEAAALAYMRVPIVHGAQRVLAADALLAAGKQLEKLDRAPQSAKLYRDIVTDYPACPAHDEARQRLEALAAAPAAK